MTKRILHLLRRGLALFGIVSLLSVSILLQHALAYAASSPSDPLVAIAVDTTGPSCTEVFQVNIHTPHASSSRIACPAGTIMSSAIVPRSQAIARHDAYVVLPSGPQTAWQKMRGATQQLMIRKRQALLGHGKEIAPLTACGTSNSISVDWYGGLGAHYFSIEYFYKTSDCRYVTLEQAVIYSYPGADIYDNWDYDLYAGGRFDVPGFPYLYGDHLYTHNVDQNWPPGFYYENWVFIEQVGYSDVNIGPIR